MGAPHYMRIRAAAGLVGLLLLGACAASIQEEDVDAMGDFGAVNELGEAESITTTRQVEQEVLNDRYVIVDNGKGLFLIEYVSRCLEDPITGRVRPDVRRDGRKIYAGADTFRGCRIRKIYPITEEQAQELRDIGEAPGERN